MYKRISLFVTLVMVLTLLLSACSTAKPATQEPVVDEVVQTAEPVVEEVVETEAPVAEVVTLKIVHNYSAADPKGPTMAAVLSEFMATHPNILIEEETFTDEDIPVRVETAFMAGEEPDIIFHNLMSNSREWTANGLTVPVDGLTEEWGLKDQFVDAALSNWTIADQVVAFPYEGFVWPVWYNSAIFEEAGVGIPKTIDELVTASEKIRAAGYQPFALYGGEGAMQMLGLISVSLNGWDKTKELYSQGGWSTDPAGVAAVELFVQLRDAGVFADESAGLDELMVTESFFAGEVAMVHLGSWSFSSAPAEIVDSIVLDGFPMPADLFVETPNIFGAFISKGIWITRNGATKMDAVEEFVKFFISKEVVNKFVEETSTIAPLKGMAPDASKISPLLLDSLGLGEKTTITPPVGSVVPGEVRPILWQNVGPLTLLPESTSVEILEALDQAYTGQ